ncbi:MAG: hypothetical protein ISS88_00505 [Candidatus Portnoybacteria bacterium]|nr:hypothetical protein [Candidatus Portnoybacteria bacterium]
MLEIYDIIKLMEVKLKAKNNKNLPSFFRPLLWSYNFDSIDLEKDKKTIIVNTINYGDLKHWRWVVKCYGKETIKKILTEIPATELRPRVRNLAALIFSIENFNYAPRGTR